MRWNTLTDEELAEFHDDFMDSLVAWQVEDEASIDQPEYHS